MERSLTHLRTAANANASLLIKRYGMLYTLGTDLYDQGIDVICASLIARIVGVLHFTALTYSHCIGRMQHLSFMYDIVLSSCEQQCNAIS